MDRPHHAHGAPPAADPALAGTCSSSELPGSPFTTVGATSTLGSGSDATIAVTGRLSRAEPVDADLSRPLSDGRDRYAEGELLGVGGMGEVRLHGDARIGRQVALKTLRSEVVSGNALARFVREARVQGQLEHPSIVPVYDLGVDPEGRPFFTMKRVRGPTLSDIIELLKSGDADAEVRFSRHKLLAAFARICLTVEYAHARGVVHRDLKPSNIMLGDFGEAYVLDWGVAKLAHDTDIDGQPAVTPTPTGAKVTLEGDVLGTPLYMAPEQLTGRQATVDARADVYALGAILFELLTLSPMRSPERFTELLAGGLRGWERPSTRTEGVPVELDELCASAVCPDRDARLRSAGLLAAGIERFLEGDRDEAARHAQAARLLEGAKAKLAATTAPDPMIRVDAMRDALKALALSPHDVEAQRLLLSLVVDGSGSLPEEAEREFEEADVRTREQGLRIGLMGYTAWMIMVPFALWVGVRDWTMPGALSALVLACIAVSALALKFWLRSRIIGIAIAVLTAAAVAGVSSWLGPFVVAPAAATGAAAYFVIHSTRRERPWLIAIWCLSALLPFGVELTGLVPPGYTFTSDGDLVLHARALRLPEGPTLVGLAYVSASYVLLLCIAVGRLRDKQRLAERSLFVQAWHLRKLFPRVGP
jgi:eukaryotic-like serine/threonine-protein kinase